ncbi:MAG: hypothetical protein HWQ41_24620 [Nostoc sp. NOS(2021)]|uniref:hypothetical protein n=1 Tax=Nostoc sp. NOS(2021) TaxID=2815407 RepID=UPI0025D9C421|nr:hypothetical protein [Nostoc sp. NOS(2021)]MBN3898340.1 hypothetical protein [Nostoc sp. NOS(2021)]
MYIRGQITGSKHPDWRQTINLPDNQILATPVLNTQTSPENSKTKSNKFNVFNILVQFRKIINTVFLGGILGILVFNLWWEQQPKTVEWEYRIESFEDTTFDTSINQLGEDKWELVFARRALAGEDSSSRGIYECIFRRAKIKK